MIRQPARDNSTVMRRVLLDAAYSYIESSPQFPVFPVDPATKHPLIKLGKDFAEGASTDPAQIEHWILHRFPECGIATPTGAASGVVVIDADRKHDGEELLAALERALGPLPRVRVVRTQSGGLHIYLAHPGTGIRVRTGAGARSPLGRLLNGRAGLDVRADGGIVVLPPSNGYRWIADEDEPPPSLPPRWLAAIQGAGDPPPPAPRPARRGHGRRWNDPEHGAPIPDGCRSTTLYRRGAMLHLTGATDAELLDDLCRMNAARCQPPLSEREVMRIASSAARATGRRS